MTVEKFLSYIQVSMVMTVSGRFFSHKSYVPY